MMLIITSNTKNKKTKGQKQGRGQANIKMKNIIRELVRRPIKMNMGMKMSIKASCMQSKKLVEPIPQKKKLTRGLQNPIMNTTLLVEEMKNLAESSLEVVEDLQSTYKEYHKSKMGARGQNKARIMIINTMRNTTRRLKVFLKGITKITIMGKSFAKTMLN